MLFSFNSAVREIKREIQAGNKDVRLEKRWYGLVIVHTSPSILLAILCLTLCGCATRGYVRECVADASFLTNIEIRNSASRCLDYTGDVDDRLDSVVKDIYKAGMPPWKREEMQRKINELQRKLDLVENQ